MNLCVRPAAAAPSRIAAAAFALALVLSGASARAADALPYARSYLLTGGYVASGVDLTDDDDEFDRDGFVTGTIHIKGVPTDADIVAAYLYYETITPTWQVSKTPTATFRGEKILLNDLMAVKKSKQDLTGKMGACWSWGGAPLTVTMVRVDVLRWLPIRVDKDNKATGKRLVNDADLMAHRLPLHKVKLPVRRGFRLPESAGASLVIVYRDPSQPLRKIVFYDGIRVQSSVTEVTSQNLRGFYKSSSKKSAQLTEIFASGRRNQNRRVFFDDGTKTQISPIDRDDHKEKWFWGFDDDDERGWWTQTFDVSRLMNPGNNSGGGYGETAKTVIDHWPARDDDRRSYDCLTLGAIIFQASVADVDGDGLPDGLEDAVGGLKDPDGQPLPDLNAMGARSRSADGGLHKDLFVEFNGMWAAAGTSYGSVTVPYDPKDLLHPTVTDTHGHNHMPTPEMLKLVGDAYLAHHITPHFDVGDVNLYHALNPLNDPQKLGVVQHIDWVDDYTSTVADQYLVPSTYARGGEVVKEVACTASNPRCQFPDFPGTVGWKFGLEGYRDQPVGNHGEELSNYANWNASDSQHRRRFDRDRIGLFHYVLYAHARGNPRSDFPCVIGGVPAPLGSGGTCAGQDNADFHHPTTASGVGDLPGGNVLVTLGLWDDFVGRPFPRASTTFHELGHNLNLWHGGFEAAWGNRRPLSGSPTSTYIEPNCKPNYLSSMSYLFQVIGLFDKFDNIHLDYSDRDFAGTSFNSLNEKGPLTDLPLPDAPYLPAWFAPAGSPLALSLGSSPAKRFCDGSKFGVVPPPPVARVHVPDVFSLIDWSGDPKTNATGPQNVNFDATPDGKPTYSAALRGFNDWAAIRLDQIGAGRRAVKFQDGDFADFGSGDFTDFGSGDFTDFGSGDFTDFGSGDFTDFGSGLFLINSSGDFVDFGSGDFVDFGSGDFTDFGSGDFLDFGSGSERQELDFETAKALTPTAPYSLSACIVGQAGCTPAAPFDSRYHRVEVDFQSSPVGHVFQYVVERKTGDAASANPYATAGATTTLSFIDPAELADGQLYTYHVQTEFDDETPHRFSPWSDSVTIPAVNDPPTAGDDTFSATEDTPLTMNVLGNDSDDDSTSALSVVLVTVPPSAKGVLTKLDGSPLNVGDVFTGSFVFAPAPDFEGGPVSFSYKASNGTWIDGVSRPLNAAATVTISSVNSRHTTTSLSSSPNPSVYGSAMTFTAVVSPETSGLGTPTGMVTFKDGAISLGTQPLNGLATATLPIPLLSAGHHLITAEYTGDIHNPGTAGVTGFYGSTSTPLDQLVQKATATIVVTPYNVPYSGVPHTATGTATGVLSEPLAGLDLSGTSHTNAGNYTGDHADPWTFTNPNYNDASGTVSDQINRVFPKSIGVAGYNVAYDGNPHTATGIATGVLDEDLTALLDLSGTTHTVAGEYDDPLTFVGNQNYLSKICVPNPAVLPPHCIHDLIAGVLVVSPPASVLNDVLTDNSHTFRFLERAGFTLTSAVHVDISASGTVFNAATQLTPQTIPTGTLVDSTFIHHDQSGAAQNTQKQSFTFDTDVIGIIVLDASLVSSNGQLGAAGTAYQTSSVGQGYELNTGGCSTAPGSQEQITLSTDRRTVTICTNVYGEPDDIRVITQGRPYLIGNSAAFGSGPIFTFNHQTGATVGSFIPDGAQSPGCNLELGTGCHNGRGLAVFNNEVYYTELADLFGATDSIRVAPFNSGAGGSDTRTLPNPRPDVGIQDLAFSGGVLYVLTGYPGFSDPPALQVFGLNPVTGAIVSGPVTIGSPADPDADGFTILPNGNFLINTGDASCTYNQFNPSTGAVITSSTMTVPGGATQCTGVDTDGVSLFFLTDFNSITKTNLSGTFISSTPVNTDAYEIEDIALVK